MQRIEADTGVGEPLERLADVGFEREMREGALLTTGELLAAQFAVSAWAWRHQISCDEMKSGMA